MATPELPPTFEHGAPVVHRTPVFTHGVVPLQEEGFVAYFRYDPLESGKGTEDMVHMDLVPKGDEARYLDVDTTNPTDRELFLKELGVGTWTFHSQIINNCMTLGTTFTGGAIIAPQTRGDVQFLLLHLNPTSSDPQQNQKLWIPSAPVQTFNTVVQMWRSLKRIQKRDFNPNRILSLLTDEEEVSRLLQELDLAQPNETYES